MRKSIAPRQQYKSNKQEQASKENSYIGLELFIYKVKLCYGLYVIGLIIKKRKPIYTYIVKRKEKVMIRRKQVWTNEEYCCVLRSIKKWLNSRFFCTKDGIVFGVRTNREMEELLGLPYTSSGRAACVGVTNTLLYLDYDMQYHVNCFEMDTDGVIVAVCYDNNENELLIPINK